MLSLLPGFQDSSAEIEKYKKETQGRIQKCINICKSWQFEENLIGRKLEEFYCGLLLSQLFAKLKEFETNDTEINILLTKIILGLSNYPFVVVHAFIFSTQTATIDLPSLYQILLSVSPKILHEILLFLGCLSS